MMKWNGTATFYYIIYRDIIEHRLNNGSYNTVALHSVLFICPLVHFPLYSNLQAEPELHHWLGVGNPCVYSTMHSQVHNPSRQCVPESSRHSRARIQVSLFALSPGKRCGVRQLWSAVTTHMRWEIRRNLMRATLFSTFSSTLAPQHPDVSQEISPHTRR